MPKEPQPTVALERRPELGRCLWVEPEACWPDGTWLVGRSVFAVLPAYKGPARVAAHVVKPSGKVRIMLDIAGP